MDVRDLDFWSREAEIHELLRKKDAIEASAMGQQPSSAINETLARIRWTIYGLEHEDDIEDMDRRAREKRARDREAGKKKAMRK